MGTWKSFLAFNRQERNGIFYLLLGIILLQSVYFLVVHLGLGGKEPAFRVAPDNAARMLETADSLLQSRRPVRYPFNPNFISDFRGYTLGLSLEELDKLHDFRAGGNYVNSVAEFQKITGVSDSLLGTFSSLFRFGDYRPAKPAKTANKASSTKGAGGNDTISSAAIKDLNQATTAQLQTVHGIGKVLSERIIRFRKALGGFLTERQLLDVYGLDRNVAIRAMARFKVFDPPEVARVNINTATVDELAANVYIPFSLARSIVRYREQAGPITSLEELSGLQGFPTEKIDRISLYLSL
jgi:competence ComEA-like helix-hairpin-helix protein